MGHPPRSDQGPRGTWRILCFASPYPQKRLELVPDVAKELIGIDPELPFEFVLTLPHNCRILRRVERRARTRGVQDRINNVGPVPVAEGPDLYKSCDISFMPTVMETFSATYPEAMAMSVPIVTSDLSFAKDVCGDAALYFEPNNVQSAATQLLRVIRDRDLRTRLTETGRSVLRELPTPNEQYHRYTAQLSKLVRSVGPGNDFP
jgi:glycosyltransferase involved in cell wall biosynthesis